MKALAVFPEERDVRMIDVPEPAPRAGHEVLIHPLEVGICGTDREIVRSNSGVAPSGETHLVLGHEMLGVVVDAGPEARDFKKGDLVVPTVRRPCPDTDCEPCRSEQSDMCYTGRFTERGIRSAHGFMADLIVEDAAFLARVPSSLRSVGALVEPLTVTEKALEEILHIQRRLAWECRGAGSHRYHCRSALVLGAGPVGFLAALALAQLGMRTFLASRNDPNDPKIRVLEKAGVRYLCTRERSPAEVRESIGNIDLIYEAAGSSELAFSYLAQLGINGIYVLAGVPGPGNEIRLDGDSLMRRMVSNNQVVVGVVNANIETFRRSVARLQSLCDRYPETMEAMITARVPLEQFAGHLARKTTGEIKTVFTL